MLSIIVCSRTSILTETFIKNIENTVGVVYELICIDNSSGNYSIPQAYNQGILKSKYQYLCFVHDDVYFSSPNWGEKVIAHLDMPQTGIIGLAGGDAALKILYDYAAIHPSANITHVDKKGLVPDDLIWSPDNYSEPTRSVLLLDGVFLCSKRELFNEIKYDEALSKFHGYDFDISLQSIVAGYFNYVIYDIDVSHYSRGNFNATYYKSIMCVHEKWKNYLPLFEHSISEEEQKQLIPIFEKKAINKLLKKLVRSRIKTVDIIEIYRFYAKIADSKRVNFLMLFLRLRIYSVWINSYFRKKII
jgi:hypothetical protein